MRSRIAVLAAVALSLTACGSTAPAATSAATAAASTAASSPAAEASPACTLKTTFDYIVRDTEPGLPASAQEIGNVDLGNCTPSLGDFAAGAGQAQGECETIALASANPGYDVNATPAKPLRKVIESAGPGC